MGWMASSFWRRRMSGCSRLGTDARRAAWRLALNVLVNGLPANKPAFRPAGQVGNLPHLKINAQSELDQPRVHGRAADLSERGRIQVQARARIAGQREVGVVQQVEKLGPELHAPAFGDGEVLENRPVHV